MSDDKYILVGQSPVVEPDLITWAKWFEANDRTVARTEIGASVVSTVFLGLNYNWGSGPPLLFETMVFTDGDGGNECRHCSTWLEAEAQHAEVVAECRKVVSK